MTALSSGPRPKHASARAVAAGTAVSLVDRRGVIPGLALGAVAAVAVTAALLGPAVGLLLVLVPLLALALLRSRRDTVTLLVVLVSVLFLWPSPLRVAALGAAGTPAVIGGGLALGVWLVVRLRRAGDPALRLQPTRIAAYLVLGSTTISYVAAYLARPDALELRSADRGLILIVASVGLCLLVADGVDSLERLEVLVRAVVLAATGMGLLALVEFVTGFSVTASVSVPGFSRLVSDWTSERSGFSRVFATAEHPIELSAVLAMCLPLALYCATTDVGWRVRAWWVCAAIIGIGLPLTVSRTAVLGGAIAICVSSLGWTRRQRFRVALCALPALFLMRSAFPGLLGTLRALFAWVGQDPSVSSRSSDYEVVGHFVEQSPVFGRGYATFLPTKYLFLDNQYLLSAIETGLFGAFVVLVFLVGGVLTARGAGQQLARSGDRRAPLGLALVASLLVALVTSALYDAWSFGTGRGVTFLLVGLAGALWRLSGRAVQPAVKRPEGVVLAEPPRSGLSDCNDPSSSARWAVDEGRPS